MIAEFPQDYTGVGWQHRTESTIGRFFTFLTFFSIRGGVFTRIFFENTGKMTLVGEAGKISDVEQRVISIIQKLNCLFDTQFTDIFPKCQVIEMGSELARQVRRVHLNSLRNAFQTNTEIGIDVVLNQSLQFGDPARGSSAALFSTL